MKKHYFQIKYGFHVNDSITVEGAQVEKAIYAQVKKISIQIGDIYLNGSNIIVIRPAYYKHTGWYYTYEPTNGDDFEQIKRDCPDYTGVIEVYKNRVKQKMEQGKINEIGEGEQLTAIEDVKHTSDFAKELSEKFSTGTI